MILTDEIKNEIKLHAKEELPRECCGLILDGEGVYKAKNISQEKNKFKVDPEDFLSASRLAEVLAVYHSHLKEDESKFSEYDKFNSISHGILYVLYSMKDNSFSQFDPALTAFHKYIGREFKIGETDCWQLIKDFYESELNIKFREYHRDKTYKSYLKELFNLGMETSGFYYVNQLQKYDCLLFGKSSTPFHIGLYLGDGLFLHQPPNSYSRIEDYTEKHKKMTKYIVRHHEFN